MSHYHQAAIDEEGNSKLLQEVQVMGSLTLPPPFIERVVKILNRAFQKDPQAVELMVRSQTPCNLELATMDHIADEDVRRTYFAIGGLGLLNGILGPLTGSIVVVMVRNGKMHGFTYQKSYSTEYL